MRTSDTENNSFEEFKKAINEQDDIVYGIALYFECLQLIHGADNPIVETVRKQLRNLIQKGNERTKHARQLLTDAKNDPEKAELLNRFTFAPCEGYQNPELMTRRAQILTETLKRIFPNRSLSQDFTEDEIFRLIEESSIAFEQQDA